MYPLTNTHIVDINNLSKSSHHSLHLSGYYLNNTLVLINAQIAFDTNLGCVIKLLIKSNNQVIINNLLDTLSS